MAYAWANLALGLPALDGIDPNGEPTHALHGAHVVPVGWFFLFAPDDIFREHDEEEDAPRIIFLTRARIAADRVTDALTTIAPHAYLRDWLRPLELLRALLADCPPDSHVRADPSAVLAANRRLERPLGEAPAKLARFLEEVHAGNLPAARAAFNNLSGLSNATLSGDVEADRRAEADRAIVYRLRDPRQVGVVELIGWPTHDAPLEERARAWLGPA